MNISARTIIKVLSLTTAFVGVLWFGYLTFGTLSTVAGAAFFAVAINPAVERLQRLMPRRSRGLAIAAVMSVGLLVVVTLMVSFVPPLVNQSTLLVKNLPSLADQLLHGQGWVSDLARQYNLADRVKESQGQIASYVSSFGSQAVVVVRGILSGLVLTLTVVGLTFFMSLEGPRWINRIMMAVPSRRRARVAKLLGQMYRAVTGYVTGNAATSLMITVICTALLFIVGVPYALPLGILVGLLDLVPLVGATLAAAVVVAVAAFTSWVAAIIMLIFFVIYQQIENHIIQPVVYGKTVQVSPLVVLIAILVGAELAGIFGALVAIPAAASIQILVRDYFERRPTNS